MSPIPSASRSRLRLLLLLVLLLTVAVYGLGLSGGYIFDDFGNLVDNPAFAQISNHQSFWQAIWASGSGPTDRPISMLSFALQAWFTGLAPWPLKLVNVLIHLINGVLIFLLSRAVLAWLFVAEAAPAQHTPPPQPLGTDAPPPQPVQSRGAARLASPPIKGEGVMAPPPCGKESIPPPPCGKESIAPPPCGEGLGRGAKQALLPHGPGRGWGGGANHWLITPNTLALLVAAAWLLSPMQLTAVLYVVQRMESLAALFVLLGLLAYWHGRQQLIHGQRQGWRWVLGGLIGGTLLATFSKETGVMLPVYAFLLEALVLRGRGSNGFEGRLIPLYAVFLVAPGILGMLMTLPSALNGSGYAGRPFDLAERLWTEGRVLFDYLHWLIAPSPNALSLYHDDIPLSTGWLAPWTTAASWAGIAALLGIAWWLRQRAPWIALGIFWFFAGHSLVSTYIPLELVYEHRNYLPSWGVFLALFGLMFAWSPPDAERARVMRTLMLSAALALIALYAGITALRAQVWGNPYRLAYFEATTHPDSPRASYDLGRMMLIMAPGIDSPLFQFGMQQLEQTRKLPGASIQADQALIFMSAKNHLPIAPDWWQDIRHKLDHQPPSAEDVAALFSLIQCGYNGVCHYSAADLAALGHTLHYAVARYPQNAGLITLLANYEANLTHEFSAAYGLMQQAVALDPKNFSYWNNLVTLQIAAGQLANAAVGIERMGECNAKGTHDAEIAAARAALAKKEAEVGQ